VREGKCRERRKMQGEKENVGREGKCRERRKYRERRTM
jgi:hypothetical protein